MFTFTDALGGSDNEFVGKDEGTEATSCMDGGEKWDGSGGGVEKVEKIHDRRLE